MVNNIRKKVNEAFDTTFPVTLSEGHQPYSLIEFHSSLLPLFGILWLGGFSPQQLGRSHFPYSFFSLCHFHTFSESKVGFVTIKDGKNTIKVNCWTVKGISNNLTFRCA